jgi:hypothetical protein
VTLADHLCDTLVSPTRLQEAEMKGRAVAGVVCVAAGVMWATTLTFSQTKPPIEGPAADGSPAMFLQASFPIQPDGRSSMRKAT